MDKEELAVEESDKNMAVKINITDLIDYTEAAKIIGCSRPSIYHMIYTFKLHPIKIGKSQFLLREEVESVPKKTNNNQ